MKKLMVCMLLCLMVTVTNATIVQWDVSSGGNGHYYELVYDYIPWQDASTAAALRTFNGVSGYLASATSEAENDFLTSMIVAAPEENFFDFYAAWLGGYRNANESSWQWATGESWSYSNWDSSEPNGKLYADAHMHLLKARSDNPSREGYWNDYDTDLGPMPVEAYFVEYIPEPATLLLFGLGGLVLRRKHRA